VILAYDECMTKILNIADTCFNLGYWPSHFKQSISIIIPKPNKSQYDTSKAFHSIVLLNTLGKLIEKVVSHHIQFQAVQSTVLHPNQLGGIIQRSTTDAGLFLTHTIRTGWIKHLKMSIVAFNIAQFFPSLNHETLTDIISLAGFDHKVVAFFRNYLTDRYTTYSWNSFLSTPFPASVGVGQGSALSLVLSALYLAPVLYLFEKRARNLENPLPISILSFVDNGLLISQEKKYEKSLDTLACGYSIISSLLTAVGLVLEHEKSEVFHFSRARNDTNPPLDLSHAGSPLLYPKKTWRYLGFYFNKKLSFRHHTQFYANKALSTVKALNLLGNSSRGLLPLQKRLLYRTCVLPIALYGFQLWFFKGAPTYYPLQNLNRMQCRAALWITGAF